jgi:GMP synthase-like glutamine amidotransferase
LAKACDARVKKAAQKEIGWALIRQTDEGKADSLFAGLGEQLAVFQWHEDTFDVPSKGALLSTSEIVTHQAFKVGRHAYGLQYHIEVDEGIIADWVEEYFRVAQARESEEGRKMLDQFNQLKKQYFAQAKKIYRNFVDIVESARRQKSAI